MKKKLLVPVLCLLASCLYAQDSITISRPGMEESLKQLPVLWTQMSGEYRALCYQAFNTAQWRLEKMLKKKKRKEHWAIVTDLDETILDNSYEEVIRIRKDKVYNSTDWNNWVQRSVATEVPGAGDFLRWVHQQGITIFYISNRDTSQVLATLLNLQKLQLPDADTAHMLFKSNSSSKETRRQTVMSWYKVVMLLGDNLDDFTDLYYKKDNAAKKAEVDSAREEWGKKFIVLPNSIYGDWENALYNYNFKLTAKQRDAMRKSWMKEL